MMDFMAGVKMLMFIQQQVQMHKANFIGNGIIITLVVMAWLIQFTALTDNYGDQSIVNDAIMSHAWTSDTLTKHGAEVFLCICLVHFHLQSKQVVSS